MADEVEDELEAVEAVYGDDCTILQRSPPHVSIALKPRTADDLSRQFVEAVLVIKANDQYPAVVPAFELRDTKGLDDKRHAKLMHDLYFQASELSPGPMLVAISEAAKDLLTSMNVPDGDCCFCMLPLVMGDPKLGSRPFMKLMSCFHCFHSDCFGRWWRWLHTTQSVGEQGDRTPSVSSVERVSGKGGESPSVQCPVCRCFVQPEDIAHVASYTNSDTSAYKDLIDEDSPEFPELLISDIEIVRQKRFAAEFEAQQARGGIIEPKKLEVILPGMVLPSHPISHPSEEPQIQPSPTTLTNGILRDGTTGLLGDVENPSFVNVEIPYGGYIGRDRPYSRRNGPPRGNSKFRNTLDRRRSSVAHADNVETGQVLGSREDDCRDEVELGDGLQRTSLRDDVVRERHDSQREGSNAGSTSETRGAAPGQNWYPITGPYSRTSEGDGRNSSRGHSLGIRRGRGRPRSGHGDQSKWKPMSAGHDGGLRGRGESNKSSNKVEDSDSAL